jgi:hypothetical protein
VPPGWSPVDLRRSDAHRSLLREVVLAVRPRWLRFQGRPISNALRSLVSR